jgi:XTP/dITP diphosphohydrolase
VEGVCRGTILEKPRGTGGFGYDPVFLPEGFDMTLAEMDLAVKNSISHRGRAVGKMLPILREFFK